MGKLIVANYKMNGDKYFYHNIQKKFNKLKLQDTKIILCPPFVYLPSFKIKNKNFAIGSQDISNKIDNKSTGQISPKMLTEFGVEYCLINHSERKVLGEGLDIAKEKIANSINEGIQPIICIDENEVENGIEKILKGQKLFSPIFAYEPSWAIDSGKFATVEEINLVVDKIKSQCKKLGFDCKVLYGGGVDLKTYSSIKTAEVDGFLLGGVCLNVDETILLIKEVDNE